MIYEEAYGDPESPVSEMTGQTLAEDYPTLETLRHAIPRLVLAHNLHGVDIDPRCAQIAQLALWMRAQRAYRDFDIKRAARPQIRRSNIVTAEPLIADDQVAADFVDRLDDQELAQIFKDLTNSLALAGDLGLLLCLESGGTRPLAVGYERDLLTPPKERLNEALSRFMADPATLASIRRRLFADDAAHGLGLLSIADQRYDTVLMNPPFGACSTVAKIIFEKQYPDAKKDIYAAFIQRGIVLLSPRGRLGAITSRSCFFLSSFQNWREGTLLGAARPVVVADLGHGVLDAMVETAAYCLEAQT